LDKTPANYNYKRQYYRKDTFFFHVSLARVSFLEIFNVFWNGIVPAGMERMAFTEPLQGDPASLYDSKTLNRQRSISGTGREKTAAGSQEDRKAMLIKTDQKNNPFLH
jgi:hypothetical protein